MQDSKIGWTDDTTNPWWGCTKASPGCANCYAKGLAHRFKRAEWGPSGERWIRVHKAQLELDRSVRKAIKDGRPRRVFLSSMCDLFEDRADLMEPRKRFWEHVHHHQNNSLLADGRRALTPLILTKRPSVMAAWSEEHGWPEGAWAGTSLENQDQFVQRVRALFLVACNPHHHFLSLEPLLDAMDVRDALWPSCEFKTMPPDTGLTWSEAEEAGLVTTGRRAQSLLSRHRRTVRWVIAGRENGRGARPIDLDWLRSIRQQCEESKTPFFLKGEDLDGKTWNQFPNEAAAP